MAQISRATGIPTEELIRTIGASLISKSNAFLIKARKEEASGGSARTIPGTERELKPIAGYFPVPPETMSYEISKQGKISRWKQQLPNGEYKFFNPEDVVHFYFNRKEGFTWGTPTIVPVIDDIKSLRKIEENIELLVYQHLFPLFHYKVCTDDFPAGIDEQGNSEIDVAKSEIKSMPSEGGLITSHRHEIKLIGAENRSLRAEGYLEHFKKRVFSGLGISAVDMGEGECYTADTETLTENGWKLHWQINHLTEKIATFNPETKRIEFHFAHSKHLSEYNGPVYSSINFKVTPKHDLYLRQLKDARNKPVKSEFNKIWARDAMSWAKYKQITGAALCEPEVPTEIPNDISDDWFNLLGMIAGRGYLFEDKINLVINRKDWTIDFDLPRILNRFKIPFTTMKSDTAHQINITLEHDMAGELKKFLRENPNLFNEISQFAIPQRIILLNRMFKEYIFKASVKKNTGLIVINAPPEELNKLQILCFLVGYKAIIKNRKIMILAIPSEDFVDKTVIQNRTFKRENYCGSIYCYNVPNHLFITRFNGQIAIHGNTANRSTSESMSRNLVDSVKDIQRVLESQLTDFVINELLLESTFGNDVLNEDSRVTLKFKEIDLEYQIRKEAHYADQFNKNVITHHEARMGAGRQPIRFPTAEEIESDPDISSKYPEWFATYWKLIDEPKSLIQSMDEPYTATAKAAAASPSTSVTSSQVAEAGEEKKEVEKELIKARPTPAAKKKDSVLSNYYTEFENQTLNMIDSKTYTPEFLKQIGFVVQTEMVQKLKAYVISSFISGYKSVNIDSVKQINATMKIRSLVEERLNLYVSKLIKQTVQAVNRQEIDNVEKGVKIQKVKAAFEALRFRNDFIETTETKKAFFLGQIEAARDLGKTQWKLEVFENSCDMCKNTAKRIFNISETVDLEDLPPFHPGSKSRISIV